MTQASQVTYGTIAALVAECGALEMSTEWLQANNFRYAVLPLGGQQHDTEFFPTLEEARTEARHLAAVYNCPIAYIA